jgi:mannose-1-phosphate guanylyltransferase
MERTRRRRRAAVVVPLAAGWSDVGSWDALHEACPGRRGQRAAGDVLLSETQGCYVYSEAGW